MSYIKSAEDAEEITQDVFVKIYKSASTFKGQSSIKTWIYRIVVNTSLNYLKKHNRFALFKNRFQAPEDIEFEHPGVLLENKENTATRSTANCNTNDASDGSSFYGLHWEIPANWMNEDFDHSTWPNATTYTNFCMKRIKIIQARGRILDLELSKE